MDLELYRIERHIAEEICALWESYYELRKLQLGRTTHAERVLLILDKGPMHVMKRAWVKGNRYIYLHVYGSNDVDLTVSKTRLKRQATVPVDIVPFLGA